MPPYNPTLQRPTKRSRKFPVLQSSLAKGLESLLDTHAPTGALPVGGVSVVDLGSTQHVTNVWATGDHVVLAADHPCLPAGPQPTGSFSVTLFTDVGPYNFTADAKEITFKLALGSFAVRIPGGRRFPIPAVSAPLRGELVVLAPYRHVGGRWLRFVTCTKVAEVGAFSVPGPAGTIVFSGATYTGNTAPGDCGTPVLSWAGVVGSHIAGGSLNNACVAYGPSILSDSVKVTALEASTQMLKTQKVKPKGPVAKAKAAAPAGKRKTPTARTEDGGGLVSMSPAPSDALFAPAPPTRQTHLVRDYIDMLVNPWSGKAQRLPDSCIAPTTLYKLFANRTYPLGGATECVLAIHSRLCKYDTNPVTDASSPATPSVGTTSTIAAYTYSPGSILRPIAGLAQAISSSVYAGSGSGTPIALSTSGNVWQDDFGAQVSEMQGWLAAYRCLALAVRVRIVGLPDNIFMAPGKVYFAQLRFDSTDLPTTEQDWSILETKGRATHVSTDAIRAAGSKTFFAVPDGVDKFSFRSSFVPPPGVFWKSDGISVTQGMRRFPNWSDLQGGSYKRRPVSGSTAGGDFCTVSDLVAPYFAAPFTNDATDAPEADATMVLMVACFGIGGSGNGVALEVNYAHIGEAIPSKTAPAGVETAIQIPNSSAMDEIFSAAAVIADYRPQMLQASGDRTIIGTSDAGPFGSTKASPEAAKTRRVLFEAARKSVGATYRVRKEGIWDTLSNMAGAAVGSLADDMAPRRGAGGGRRPPPRPARRSRYDDDDDY